MQELLAIDQPGNPHANPAGTVPVGTVKRLALQAAVEHAEELGQARREGLRKIGVSAKEGNPQA